MSRSTSSLLIRIVARIAFWGVLPLILGTVLAFLLVPVPQVGLIRFRDVIWADSSAYLAELLNRAQTDRRIRAVVLEIDSPGGEVTATEELYYRLLQLRQHKPVVVTIDSLAASGGYYIAAAADQIYAKPTSLVGNVGVVSFLPSTDEQRFTDEDYVSTGPFKLSGGSRGDFVRQIELSKLGFIEAVFAQRSDALQLDRERLSSGEIFMGSQALRLGLVDELGANSEALEKAASMAHVAHYRVVDLNRSVYGQTPAAGEAISSLRLIRLIQRRDPAWRQGLYYLYLEPDGRTR
jgi:protease-4